jgi:BAG domain
LVVLSLAFLTLYYQTEARGNKPVANVPTTNEPSAPAVDNTPDKPTAKAPPANEPSAKAAVAKDTTAKSVAVEDSMSGNQQTDESEPHWSAAPERARSLAEITAVNRTFTSLKNTFVFPSGPLETITDGTTPRLAYNAANAAIHAYQYALADLLSQLDGIESFGFQGVREARKQLVVKIEQAMEELEQMINERLTGSVAPTTGQSSIPDTKGEKDNQDVVIGDTEEQATISTDATAANVVSETSVAIDAGLHKDSEDVTIHETVDTPTRGDVAEVDTAASIDQAQLEEPATASAPLLTELTALEPLESQASSKEAIEADASMPNPYDTNPVTAPINSSEPTSAPAKPKAPTFSVSDEEEWEIEDAVKTVAWLFQR